MRKISFKKKVFSFLFLSLVFLLFSCGVNEETPVTPEEKETVNTSEKEFFEKILTKVLSVTTDVSGGSATVFYEEGDDLYAVTNCHVIKGAGEIYLSAFSYEKERHPAVCIWKSEEYDLALLKAEGLKKEYPALTPVTFIKEDNTFVGQRVYFAGNFESSGISVDCATVGRLGEYLSLPTSDKTLPFIRLRGDIPQGASGGPVFDENGEVLGIVTARRTDTSEGYAIDSFTVQYVVSEVIKKGYATCFDFGIEVKNIGGIVKDEPNQTAVSSLKIGSLASAFLKAGDVIKAIKINDETFRVPFSHVFSRLLLNVKEEDNITIEYIRGGKDEKYAFTVHKRYIKEIN